MASFTDPVARIEAIVAGAEPAFQKAFLELVAGIQSQATLQVIADLLARGSIEAALGNLFLASESLSVPWNATFTTAGTSTGFMMSQALTAFGLPPINVTFNQLNTGAIRVMQANRLRLVREFSLGQVEATREALLRGLQTGANPIQQARNFQGSIGLTRHQVGAVANYREALERGSLEALNRELRDRRFDPAVRRAARTGIPLTNAQVDRMVERYRQRFIKHRAQTIARTEALRAANAGRFQMFIQAFEDGTLDPSQVTQIWNTAGDARVRNFTNSATSHVSMDQQERPIGIPFTSGAGASLFFPGDPSAPSNDTIRCRCAVATRILSLDAVGTTL